MLTVVIHLNNAEAFKLDIETLPQPTDTFLMGKNPRERTDKEVEWIEDGVTTVLIPLWRITYIELLPSAAEETEFPLPFRND
jgi:hypothetical protein